jgi:hypothetical protein
MDSTVITPQQADFEFAGMLDALADEVERADDLSESDREAGRRIGTGVAAVARDRERGRIAALERLADEMLAAFAERSAAVGVPVTRSRWVYDTRLATWARIRHAGEEAVAAADELSRLGEEIQGGDSDG